MKKQNGNALWFILLAIALLGLLTAVMTRSSGTDNDTGSYEKNQIAANEILQYAKSIENAVQNLLARGCSENDISFWHDSDDNGTEDAGDDYYNANSPTDHSCHVFEPEGAGLTWLPAKNGLLDSTLSGHLHYGDWLITGNVHVNGFGTEAPSVSNCGASITRCTELVISLNFVKYGLCQSINNVTGLKSSTGEPIIDSGSSIGEASHTEFTGSFSAIHEMGTAIPASDNYSGESTGCVEVDTDPGPGSYTFYHVLHAR